MIDTVSNGVSQHTVEERIAHVYSPLPVVRQGVVHAEQRDVDDRLTDRPPVGQAIDVDQIQGVAVVLEVQITPRHRKEAHRTTNRTNPGGLEALWASFPKIEKFPKKKRNRLLLLSSKYYP